MANAKTVKCTVVYDREPDGRWIVSIPDVRGCHSHGRTIEQARGRIREALALFVPARTAAAAEFEEDIRLPQRVEKDVFLVRELRGQLESTKQQLAEVERRAVRKLRQDAHLGHRDAGEILGLSHQRVHQLENASAVYPRPRSRRATRS